MSESVATPAVKSASSFASFLESFTGSAKNASDPWDDSALLDDVATVSYEHALRAHRRTPPSFAPPASESSSPAVVAHTSPPPTGKERKSASITLRLTQAEELQLHARAAAAQLSVSAYLRSCIFEAEELRAQVKQALAQMQAAGSLPTTADQPASVNQKRFHLFPRWPRRNKTEN